jgi:hypothetical protein
MIFTGKTLRTLIKTGPSATLTTTNPTWTDADVNLGLHIERPATNCLSHGVALCYASFECQASVRSA